MKHMCTIGLFTKTLQVHCILHLVPLPVTLYYINCFNTLRSTAIQHKLKQPLIKVGLT